MQKVLLLDFDGVLLKHSRSSFEISKRSQNFVRMTTNVVNDNEARHLNANLYKNYGHTVLGLQRMGYKVSVADFNKYVYSGINYDELFTDFKRTNSQDIRSFTELAKFCRSQKIPIYIFSNAPNEWCGTIMDMMLQNDTFYNFVDTSDELKPSFVLYENVSYKFKGKKIVFVDDSFINFTNSFRNNQWTNVHYTSDKYTINKNNNNLYTIDSLDKIYDFL